MENKYRLLEVEDIPQGFTTYVIEKRVKFLFWEWWSRDYLYNGWGKNYKGKGHYHFSSLEKGRAEKTLEMLNTKSEAIKQIVIG